MAIFHCYVSSLEGRWIGEVKATRNHRTSPLRWRWRAAWSIWSRRSAILRPSTERRRGQYGTLHGCWQKTMDVDVMNVMEFMDIYGYLWMVVELLYSTFMYFWHPQNQLHIPAPTSTRFGASVRMRGVEECSWKAWSLARKTWTPGGQRGRAGLSPTCLRVTAHDFGGTHERECADKSIYFVRFSPWYDFRIRGLFLCCSDGASFSRCQATVDELKQKCEKQGAKKSETTSPDLWEEQALLPLLNEQGIILINIDSTCLMSREVVPHPLGHGEVDARQMLLYIILCWRLEVHDPKRIGTMVLTRKCVPFLTQPRFIVQRKFRREKWTLRCYGHSIGAESE